MQENCRFSSLFGSKNVSYILENESASNRIYHTLPIRSMYDGRDDFQVKNDFFFCVQEKSVRFAEPRWTFSSIALSYTWFFGGEGGGWVTECVYMRRDVVFSVAFYAFCIICSYTIYFGGMVVCAPNGKMIENPNTQNANIVYCCTAVNDDNDDDDMRFYDMFLCYTMY